MPLKLLDYGKPHPFGEILGNPRNLAWPVNAYRVTLPKVAKDGDDLNLFERVILKIIDSGGEWESEALARETCIPVDLVRCVLLCLRDKAFIDEHNKIIKQRRNDWENKKKKPSEFVTALLFRELAMGKILPFFYQLDDTNPLKKKEGEERFFRRVHYNNAYKSSPPTPRNVISALRGMIKRLIAFDAEVRLPAVQEITIVDEPELYYLDCPIAIQKSDGEFRIADPFGTGFSLILENALNHLLEQDSGLSNWLMNWKHGLSNPRKNKQAKAQLEPYDNDINRGRYPNLVSILRLRRNTQHRSLEQIHAAIEWAMFYACAQRSFDTAVNRLRLINQSEHSGLLKEAAEKIGLNLPRHGFRQVLLGKLDDFLFGKAEMGTVLSIALLMAQSDASHPLRRVAEKYQDFIVRLFDIRKKRNPQTHGRGKVQKNEIEMPEESFMRDIVTTLLPSVRFSDIFVAEVDKDAVADLLLDARSSIQGEFGFGLFNRLGTNLQDRLVYAERFWLSSRDGDEALAFACDLYAAMQRSFRQKLSGVLPPDFKDSEFLMAAQKSSSESGLGEMPECLCTVKPFAIRKTLQGDDQTLGACVVAFLLVSDTETLRSVADIQPYFLFNIEEVINRRGHGNEPLPLSKSDIGKLRKSTYSTIKTLLET